MPRTPGWVAGELAFALELADLADAISMRYFRRASLVVETKADRSPVSEADREVEQMIRGRIGTTRPDNAVVGEEFGSTPGRRDCLELRCG